MTTDSSKTESCGVEIHGPGGFIWAIVCEDGTQVIINTTGLEQM